MLPLYKDRALRRGRAVLPHLHAGARRPCHQLAGLVGDIALDIAQGAAGLDDSGLGGQLPLAHGLEEVDLQLDGGERFACFSSLPVKLKW